MSNIRFFIAAALLCFGLISTALGILGVFKFRFVMNRMHCAAVIDTMGLAGLLSGLMVLSGRVEYIPKLLVILLLLWIGSPIASHLVGKMELATDDTAPQYMDKEGDDSGDGAV